MRRITVGLMVLLAFTVVACSDNEPSDDYWGNVTTGGTGGATGGSAGAGGSSGATGGSSGATGGSSGATGGSSGGGGYSGGNPLGEPHSGTLSIGPVDFAETYYANGCGQYPDPLPGLYGNYLAGVESAHIDGGRMCDSCILIESATGMSAVARVITYGYTNPNDIDVSPELNDALGIVDEAGRAVTWQFVSCETQTPVYFQFHPDSHQWFFRVWIRNQRLPLSSVEVKVPGGDYVALGVQGDGAWNAQAEGGTDFTSGFTLKITSIENGVIEQDFPAAPEVYGSPPIAAQGNF